MTSNLGLKIEFLVSQTISIPIYYTCFLFKVHRVEYLPEKEQDGEIDMIYKDSIKDFEQAKENKSWSRNGRRFSF